MVFLIVLFVVNTPSILKNTVDTEKKASGLAYGDASLSDLVNKDGDADGVTDWEESLWGTDPKKRDTDDDGTSDFVEIEKLKAAQGTTEVVDSENNQTATEKFSQELFATVAALNQNDAIDESAIDKLGESLTSEVGATTLKQVYTLLDIKVKNDNTPAAMLQYDKDAGIILNNKYPMNEKIVNVLKGSLTENGDVDAEALKKLDPIIAQTEGIINGMVSMNVPSKLVALHLDLVNSFQAILENLKGIQMIDSDSIVAIGAINQYLNNNDKLDASLVKLGTEVAKNKN